MSIAFVVGTFLAAIMVGFSALSVFSNAKWIVQPLADYGVPRSWWPCLGTAKAAGTVGLLVGLFVPVLGVMSGIGLVMYFSGAVLPSFHLPLYSHIAYPLPSVTPRL